MPQQLKTVCETPLRPCYLPCVLCECASLEYLSPAHLVIPLVNLDASSEPGQLSRSWWGLLWSAHPYSFQKEPSTPPLDYLYCLHSGPLSYGPHCHLRVPLRAQFRPWQSIPSEPLAAIWEELIHLDHLALFSTWEHHNQERDMIAGHSGGLSRLCLEAELRADQTAAPEGAQGPLSPAPASLNSMKRGPQGPGKRQECPGSEWVSWRRVSSGHAVSEQEWWVWVTDFSDGMSLACPRDRRLNILLVELYRRARGFCLSDDVGFFVLFYTAMR